jgi:4-oxalocrotonate tautomerase
MPLVPIDLAAGTNDDYRSALADEVYRAMTGVMNVPVNDRFMVISEHAAANFIDDPGYAGIARSDACVFVQITPSIGRSVETKCAFYRALADGLHTRVGLRREDLFINLVEVERANWSFGNGEAQYVR